MKGRSRVGAASGAADRLGLAGAFGMAASDVD
jgi:hypothetical protein